MNFGRVRWLMVERPVERQLRQFDQVGSHRPTDWAKVPEGDAGGGEAVQDVLDSQGIQLQTDGTPSCPVSPNLARQRAAELRRARFAETASNWLSH
jgi:hypothetical protein